MVIPYSTEKLIKDIKAKLSQNQVYSQNIQSVLLDPTEKRDFEIVHINVKTNLSEQEDCRGLGNILKKIEEEYRNKVTICFHQYSNRNIN